MHCSDGSLEISITDRGPGISEEQLPQLFRKFSRLTAAVEGTGLGLYLSRAIARAHGGDIAVTSELGRGSCFALRLPV